MSYGTLYFIFIFAYKDAVPRGTEHRHRKYRPDSFRFPGKGRYLPQPEGRIGPGRARTVAQIVQKTAAVVEGRPLPAVKAPSADETRDQETSPGAEESAANEVQPEAGKGPGVLPEPDNQPA